MCCGCGGCGGGSVCVCVVVFVVVCVCAVLVCVWLCGMCSLVVDFAGTFFVLPILSSMTHFVCRISCIRKHSVSLHYIADGIREVVLIFRVECLYPSFACAYFFGLVARQHRCLDVASE